MGVYEDRRTTIDTDETVGSEVKPVEVNDRRE